MVNLGSQVLFSSIYTSLFYATRLLQTVEMYIITSQSRMNLRAAAPRVRYSRLVGEKNPNLWDSRDFSLASNRACICAFKRIANISFFFSRFDISPPIPPRE